MLVLSVGTKYTWLLVWFPIMFGSSACTDESLYKQQYVTQQQAGVDRAHNKAVRQRKGEYFAGA